MSRGNRGEGPAHLGGFGITAAIILCLLIVGGLAYSNGRESERRYQSPHHHAEAAKTSAKRSCVGIDPVAVFECVYEKVEASEETARSEQDLDAQQWMAFWALAMTLVSAAMAVISAVALYFLRGTLDETRNAVGETGKATEAMRDANRIALEAQRPWLQIEKVEAKIHALESKDMLTVLVYAWITIRNTGQRPAIKVDRREIVRPMGKGEIRRQFYVESLNKGWFDVPNIPPDGSITIDVLHMYDIQKAVFDNIAPIFSLHISFAYNDGIAESRRQTAQSYALCKKVTPNGAMKPFTRNELIAPPPPEPGAWSSGWDCDLWPEPDGIMN